MAFHFDQVLEVNLLSLENWAFGTQPLTKREQDWNSNFTGKVLCAEPKCLRTVSLRTFLEPSFDLGLMRFGLA